jgi:hypothetical protein
VTSASGWGSSKTPTATADAASGTSGVVVDNALSGASNIYFSPLANGTCAGNGTTGSGASDGCATQAFQAGPL